MERLPGKAGKKMACREISYGLRERIFFKGLRSVDTRFRKVKFKTTDQAMYPGFFQGILYMKCNVNRFAVMMCSPDDLWQQKGQQKKKDREGFRGSQDGRSCFHLQSRDNSASKAKKNRKQRLFGDWQFNVESAASSFFAFCPDVAFVKLYKFFTQDQSQTGTFFSVQTWPGFILIDCE